MSGPIEHYLSTIAVLLVLFFALAGCDDEAVEEPEVELRTEAVCEGGAPAYDVVVERHITEIGPSANDIQSAADALWIVESAANTVSRFDRGEHRLESGFVDVGNDRNPYAADLDPATGELWIANFIADTVTVADLNSGEILEEIDDSSFADPSAVALGEDHAYVANIEFLGANEGYGPGSITVVDRTSHNVVSTIESAFKNPHFIDIEVIDGKKVLLVSGGGAIEIVDGQVSLLSDGGLQWLDIEEDPVEPPSQEFSLEQLPGDNVGSPGRPQLTPDQELIYFASGIAPVLFVFDIEQEDWRYDAADPLQLYETDGEATHAADMGVDGLLWVTAFNEDALYLFDTACDELVAPPIDLGRAADMLEGPQALRIVEEGGRLEGYYLLSIANALGRVQLK